jgi:hypothetical protein
MQSQIVKKKTYINVLLDSKSKRFVRKGEAEETI